MQLARVIEVHRETLRVHTGSSELVARVLPRLSRALADQETALAVGDWGLLAHDPHGQAWLHERVPPLTHIARRDADGRRHPVVSNVDTALLVMGLDDDFNLRRLERYLALVHGSGVAPVIVLSKADVLAGQPRRVGGAGGRRACPRRRRRGGAGGERTVRAAAQALVPYLGAGQTLVLLGSSVPASPP